MRTPSHDRRRRASAAALVAAAAAILAVAPAGQARVAHAASISAKATCAKLSAGSVATAIGVPVKRAQVRDKLALPVGDRTLGFECGFYPTHQSEKYPSDETVALVDFSRTHGTAAKLHKLIHANPRYAGFTMTQLKGLGTLAYVTVQPFGEGSAAPELPQVIVWVLKGHTIFYAFSQEVAQPAVESLAKVVAGKV